MCKFSDAYQEGYLKIKRALESILQSAFALNGKSGAVPVNILSLTPCSSASKWGLEKKSYLEMKSIDTGQGMQKYCPWLASEKLY
jgi:hypothetical protein